MNNVSFSSLHRKLNDNMVKHFVIKRLIYYLYCIFIKVLGSYFIIIKWSENKLKSFYLGNSLKIFNKIYLNSSCEIVYKLAANSSTLFWACFCYCTGTCIVATVSMYSHALLRASAAKPSVRLKYRVSKTSCEAVVLRNLYSSYI